MAMAVVKLNQKGDISEGVSDTIQYFLDRLYINRSGHSSNSDQKTVAVRIFPQSILFFRISIHMLISHFNALQGHGTTLTGMVSVPHHHA